MFLCSLIGLEVSKSLGTLSVLWYLLLSFQCLELLIRQYREKKKVVDSLLIRWYYKFMSFPICLLLCAFQRFLCVCFFFQMAAACIFPPKIYSYIQRERQGRACLHLTRNLKPRLFPCTLIINMLRFRLTILLFIVCFSSQFLVLFPLSCLVLVYVNIFLCSILIYLLTLGVYLFYFL